MKVFEKAKSALRKHLLANKEEVRRDLEEMRSVSGSENMFGYYKYTPQDVNDLNEKLKGTDCISKTIKNNSPLYQSIKEELLKKENLLLRSFSTEQLKNEIKRREL